MSTAASIAETLKAKGQAMTLTNPVAGTFDPVTGGMTGATAETHTVYGITSSYGSIGRMAAQNAAGSLVMIGDKKAIISALVPPAIGGKLTIMGVAWTIIAVDPLEPQGETLLYACQIRK